MEKKSTQMDSSECMEVPNSWGGRRAGAGRKGRGFETRKLSLSLPPIMWKTIDKQQASSTAEAIRDLLEKSISSEEIKVIPLNGIPSINLKAAFYGRSVDFILKWLGELVPVTAFDFQANAGWEDAIRFVSEYYANEKTQAIIHERLLSDFPEGCAIGPKKLEEVLNCSPTERKRWEQEGRLIVASKFNTGTKRKPIWIPMYDRRLIESLTAEVIAQWRMDWETAKAMNRRQKDEKSEVRTCYVLIEAIQEGKKPYRIFGPIGVENEAVDDLWNKHRDKLPWDWEGTIVVQLRDFHTSEVLKLEVRSI